MSEPINTGQYVRGNRGIRLIHVLSILAVIGAIAGTVIAISGRDATTPTMFILVGVLFAALTVRQYRHQSNVIAAIRDAHGIEIPHGALFSLMRGNENEFTADGIRYKVASTGDPTPGNPEPARIVLTRLGPSHG